MTKLLEDTRARVADALFTLRHLAPDIILRSAFSAVQAALAELPSNKHLFTYTIPGYDRSAYLTRTLLPRALGRRLLLHHIHRPDQDVWMHNHPWREAYFLVVSGGYIEERETPSGVEINRLRVGDVNHIDAQTYHRVTSIQPGTRTIGLCGDRVQDWGFKVEGRHVPHAEYFAARKHVQPVGGIS